MRSHSGRRSTTLAVVMLAFTLASSCSSDAVGPEPSTAEQPFNPTSTEQLGGLGGALLEPITADELASYSSVAVSATVVDVRHPVANTESGLFPDTAMLAQAAERGHPLNDLLVSIPIDIEIKEVLAGDQRVVTSIGSSATIYVSGGTVRAMIPPESAAILGVFKVVASPSNPNAEMPEEIEVLPVEDVLFAWGYAPSEYLAEGTEYVLLLRESIVPGFGEDPDSASQLHVVDPAGVFVNDSGVWKPQRTISDGGTLESVLAALESP